MRFRKNLKLSSLYPSEMLQTYDCKLNQSPWDAISFSEQTTDSSDSLNQFYRENRFSSDEGLGEKMGEVGSDALLIEGKDNSKPKKGTENQLESKKREKILHCSKSDGKGWQCTNEPKRGHTLCDHHLRLPHTYNTRSKGGLSVQKSENATIHHGRTTTPKKGSISTSYANDFYYYTGFGPFRGKNRGEIKGGVGNKTVEESSSQNNSLSTFTKSDVKEVICIDDKVGKDEKNNEADLKNKKNDEVDLNNEKNDKVDENAGKKSDDNNKRKRKRKSLINRSIQSYVNI